MLKQRTKSLRDRTVVTAAILSLMGSNAYACRPDRGSQQQRPQDRQPHQARHRHHGRKPHLRPCVRDLRAARRRACRQSSVQGNYQQGRFARSELRQGGAVLDHSQQFLLDQPHARRRPTTPRPTSCRRRERPTRPRPATPTVEHGCPRRSGLPHHAVGSRPRRLRPAHAGSAAADDGRDRHSRGFAGYAHPGLRQPAERPLSAGDAAAGRGRNLQPLQDLRRQPGTSLLPDVAAARLRRHARPPVAIRAAVRPICSRASRDRLLRQQRQSDAERRSRKAISRWASTTSPRAMRPI